ncbi:hypothetical protein CRG98_021314 [Punica granatum]|uniref:Uncharacterized protein n=1 Tax=Punica granatum TaxID=22663 RepID=A0A2I0JPT1_PUNGR|nr:hypothetical protein CRG98_021314 [Punica granatum]
MASGNSFSCASIARPHGKVDTPKPSCIGFAHACPDEIEIREFKDGTDLECAGARQEFKLGTDPEQESKDGTDPECAERDRNFNLERTRN